MSELTNEQLLGRILRTTIIVIGRRTSEGYSVMIIGNILKKLADKYDILKYVELKKTQFSEANDVIEIKTDLENKDSAVIVEVIKAVLNSIIDTMGKNAGFYFIKEIKESLPFNYQEEYERLGVDFDFLQMQYLTDRNVDLEENIENSELVQYIFQSIYNILDRDTSRNFAYKTLDELVGRFTTKYQILRKVSVNDVRYNPGAALLSIDSSIDSIDPEEIGDALQKILQEITNYLDEKEGMNFIEKLKHSISSKYVLKLTEMGVNLNTITVKHGIVVEKLILSIIDVLTDVSSESFAIMILDKSIKKIYDRYQDLKHIKIDSGSYSSGFDSVTVSPDIESSSPITLGRALQKLVETVTMGLGEEAGHNFVEKLKKRLGRAYLLKIEEMGVNLYMIQLKQNLVW